MKRHSFQVDSGSEYDYRRSSPLSAGLHSGGFDAYGAWEQFKATAVQALPRADLRCERCDEAHETDLCPHFRGPRDQHADAWQHYRPSNAQLAGKAPAPMRQCIAPRRLGHHSVRVMRMPGDGSCLFHSIAYGLNALGYQEAGHTVRYRVANFIAERPDFEITGTPLRSWVDWDSRMTVNSYASRLQAGSCWGGAIEMAACAQIFAVDLAVYEEDYYGNGFRRISDFITDAKPFGAVLLLYSGRSHYDALQDLSVVGHGGGYADELQPEYHGQHAGAEDDEWGCSLM